jgi:flagellar basal-body rod modification protein FlgD
VSVPQVNSGEFKFLWDGFNEAGELKAAGQYQFRVSALVGNNRQELDTALSANVDSVTLGKGGQGMSLNLAGVGARGLADIQEIGQ